MNSRTTRHKCVSVSASRWIAYASAGAASALASATSAEAEIHYSGPINILFPPDAPKVKKLPLDQAADYLVFKRGKEAGNVGAFFRLRAGLGVGQFVGQEFSTHASVSAIRGDRYVSRGHFTYPAYTYGTLKDPHFTSPSFVGFRFNGGSGFQYGWARVYFNKDTLDFTVIDYAWADPGEPIKTGQTSSSTFSEGTNEGSLGLLALGAAGLRAWLKSRVANHTLDPG
jgi:hypothetical protein